MNNDWNEFTLTISIPKSRPHRSRWESFFKKKKREFMLGIKEFLKQIKERRRHESKRVGRIEKATC
jgi:hypothetical protein